MSALRSLAMGAVVACLGLGAAAEVIPADDGALTVAGLSADAFAPDPALGAIRPEARPAYMLRYPPEVIEGPPPVRPPARSTYIPDTQWDDRPGGDSWTRATLAAIRNHGEGLEFFVPSDIDTWCPAYRSNPPALRRAFWVGMMSALAYHESRYLPHVVGGGGQWFGLLQVAPVTARHYDCRASTGEALKDPELNLACSVRIMADQVPAAGSVARGMRAWGPFHFSSKRAQMSAWTREQDYCRLQLAVLESPRPEARPARPVSGETLSTMGGARIFSEDPVRAAGHPAD